MERYTQRREETWALAEGAELSRALDRLGRCEICSPTWSGNRPNWPKSWRNCVFRGRIRPSSLRS